MEGFIPIARYEFSYIDDPFLRPSLVIYCCGCPHNCPDCQNKELQSPTSEFCTQVHIKDICKMIKRTELIESVVYLGGDFGIYLPQYLVISKTAKKWGLHNILYTGFKFEEIDREFLKYTDVIIDGKYIKKLGQDKFPASKNQRVWVRQGGVWAVINPNILPINQQQEGF